MHGRQRRAAGTGPPPGITPRAAVRAGALALAVALALAAPSAADWAPPHSVASGIAPPSSWEMGVTAATAPDGSAGVAWTDQADGHGEVRFALVRPDGTVVGPEAVSPPGQAARDPQVAIGGDGVAHVAWISAPPGGQARALVARRDPAHGWEAPADLGPSDGALIFATAVLIAADHTGTTTAAVSTTWEAHCKNYPWSNAIHTCGAIDLVQIAADGTITRSATVRNDRETVSLGTLASDPRGGAFLVYAHWNGVDMYESLSPPQALARTLPDGSLGAPVELGEGHSPHVAASPDGTVAAVWGCHVHGGACGAWGGVIAPSGAYSGPQRVSAADNSYGGSTAVAVNPDGRATFAWELTDAPIADYPRYESAGPDGAVGRPATIPYVKPGFRSPVMAARPDGTALLVWSDRDQGLEAATFGADGAPRPARVIAAGAAYPEWVSAPVLSTSARSAMVFWRQTDGGRATVMFTREVPDAPVPPAAPAPPAGTGEPGPAALTLAGMSLTRTRFAAAAADTPRTALARGTVIRFSLSRAATVTLRFSKLTARPPRPGRRPPRTITRQGSPGANAVRFTGRIGRSALTPGRWRVTLAAAAPPDTAAPQSRTFTVLPG